jgi:cysteine desulfurase
MIAHRNPDVLLFMTAIVVAATAGVAVGTKVSERKKKKKKEKREDKEDASSVDDEADDLRLREKEDTAKQEKECIYLDYNGTTPVYPDVLAAMMPYLTKHYGNPNSSHALGREPRRAVDRARRQILSMLGAPPADDIDAAEAVLFTACGTESDNTAIHLALQTSDKSKGTPHVVTCNVEHPAVAGYLAARERQGDCQVTYVPVQPDGRVTVGDMIAAVKPNTVLVTLMLANNESGALQPVADLAKFCRHKGILFHTDAAQAVGKVDVTLSALGDPDMITVVGHKIGAPKGVACLYIRPGCVPSDTKGMLIGGGQEMGRRGGTENVASIVGFGKAAENVAAHWEENAKYMEEMRSRLLNKLLESLGYDRVRANGPHNSAHRLPNTLSAGIKGINSAVLLGEVSDTVAASAGATCHSAQSVSSVLTAMKIPMEYARGTVRLSLGPKTTTEEIDRAAEILALAAKRQLGGGGKE